jgi:SAM-dependent methyltransferase
LSAPAAIVPNVTASTPQTPATPPATPAPPTPAASPTPSNPPPAGEPGFLAATRAAYDTVAASYAEMLAGLLAENPYDRAAFTLYAELLHAAAKTAARTGASTGTGSATARPRVVEIGCGPGRITGYLAGLGLDVSGIDLSPEMVAEARRRHPQLRFEVGSMTALDLPTGSVDGIVAWYSVIHVPPSRHRAVYAGFHRVLRPGGLLQLGFHYGDERRRIEEGYGHSGLALDAYRLLPERVEQDLAASGFTTVTHTVHEPIEGERTSQASLIARALEP